MPHALLITTIQSADVTQDTQEMHSVLASEKLHVCNIYIIIFLFYLLIKIKGRGSHGLLTV